MPTTHQPSGTNRRHRRLSPILLTALAGMVALLAACGSEGARTASGPPTPADTLDIDWISRTTPADSGEYRVEFCEGESPHICIWKDGEILGAAELGQDDVASYDVVREVLAAGGSVEEALEAHAADVVATFVADRAEGCGPDYLVTADDTIPTIVGGEPGLRYGWTARRDGEVVERVIAYGMIADGTLHTLVAIGLEDDGCLERMGELPIDELDDLLATLDRVAARSRFPSVADRAEGDQRVVTARIAGVYTASATIEFDELEILSGEEARQAAVEAGQIEPGESLPNDVWLRDRNDVKERLTVDPAAVVWVYDCSAGCERVEVDLGAFLRHEVEPYGGDAAVFEITITGEAITSLFEVYLP